jgi:hypothetical protein
MADEFDFERQWQAKFVHCLDQVVGEDLREAIVQGGEELTSQSERSQVIAWTQAAMQRLESLVDEPARREVMTGCACQYSPEDLHDIRLAYQASGDIDLARRMLRERFETFLRHTLQLDDELIQDILSRGWGLAGVCQGDRIIATKIPKSGNLVAYMKETDPQVKRQLYCHCPRIRQAIQEGVQIPAVYCYCGAGFYQGIWEEITQRPVQVEVLESVLQGGEVCEVAIHLGVTDTG